MGWISRRHMRTGSSLYGLGPKRKGPLRKVVSVLLDETSTNMFGRDVVLLECGHIGPSYGGHKAICTKCRDNKPMCLENDWGLDVLATLEEWRRMQK